MSKDKAIPNSIETAISELNVSCESSCPPLNPMEKRRYNEINLEELGGISKSLFSLTANIPKIKNKKAGFVTFEISKSAFIFICF